MTGIHQTAAKGYAAKAATYVTGRPDYPVDLTEWLSGTLGLCAGRAVLDLGAGTGKFSPLLLATGASVTAVEPVSEMLAKLAARHPGIETYAGSAERIPLGNACLDAVVCAQAFHWFSTAQALAEIRRVLKPGGRLGLVWNVRDENVGWVAALTDIMAPYVGDAPRYYTGDWRRLFPAEGFGPLAETVFPHGHTGPPERVIVDRMLSVSFIAALPPDEQERVAAQARAVIAGTPELAGQASVTFPYTTVAYCCEKRA